MSENKGDILPKEPSIHLLNNKSVFKIKTVFSEKNDSVIEKLKNDRI